MKFIVEKEIFEKLPDVCFGVVMAKGIDNSISYPEIDKLLNKTFKKSQKNSTIKK